MDYFRNYEGKKKNKVPKCKGREIMPIKLRYRLLNNGVQPGILKQATIKLFRENGAHCIQSNRDSSY